jgi:hypothetical protein
MAESKHLESKDTITIKLQYHYIKTRTKIHKSYIKCIKCKTKWASIYQTSIALMVICIMMTLACLLKNIHVFLLPVTACPLEFNSLENEWPVMKKHQT